MSGRFEDSKRGRVEDSKIERLEERNHVKVEEWKSRRIFVSFNFSVLWLNHSFKQSLLWHLPVLSFLLLQASLIISYLIYFLPLNSRRVREGIIRAFRFISTEVRIKRKVVVTVDETSDSRKEDREEEVG